MTAPVIWTSPMMPTRRRSRAQNRAQRIAAERRDNRNQRLSRQQALAVQIRDQDNEAPPIQLPAGISATRPSRIG